MQPQPSSSVIPLPLGGGAATQQGYTYDPFGNLTAITGANGRTTPTTAATNRLSTGTYDAAGNLTNWNGATYQYDRFNQMVRMTSGGEDWAYVYTADDERLWSYNLAANVSTWTLRDLSGQVLRELVNENGTWTLGTDYIRRDGQLLAAETRLGRRHFHLDHLGTPRLITNSVGYQKAYHVYYPFGEEATAFNQDGERMKFTGHERDLASGAGPGDDLDYMHARHCSPVTGRFLSVDQVWGTPEIPQSWNRYGYTLGNPLKLVDPDGEHPVIFLAAVVVGGMILGSEPANAPTSADTAMLPNSGGMRALRGAGVMVAAMQAAKSFFNKGDGGADRTEDEPAPGEPYNRRKHYGSTPTQSDRRELGTGEGEVVDHNPPLVRRYYEGDPERGERPGYQMTPEERRPSANDRSRMRPQPKRESCAQGADCARYSRQKRKELGFGKQ